MAKIILPVENRSHEWADDDPRLKDDSALREFFGSLAGQYRNAEIVRKQQGDTLEVTITPRAGQKGSATVLHALLEAPEEIHPVLRLAWQLEGHVRPALDITARLERHAAMEALVEAAEAELKRYSAQLALLKAASPAPVRLTPLGF